MTRPYAKTGFIRNSKGAHSTKPKSELPHQRDIAPTTGRPVSVYMSEPYISIISEMYPDKSLPMAIRQFLVDHIKVV